MTNTKLVVTQEGLDKLKKELEHLETVERRNVAEKIAEALKFGDLRENSEYHDAKDEQAALESRILELSSKIKNAEVVSNVSKDQISVGSVVEIEEISTKEKHKYSIVGSMEANVFENLISNESPLGSSLIGKKKGDTVKFNAPGGEMEYKITKIS